MATTTARDGVRTGASNWVKDGADILGSWMSGTPCTPRASVSGNAGAAETAGTDGGGAAARLGSDSAGVRSGDENGAPLGWACAGRAE
jgi:hypothetical protein